MHEAELLGVQELSLKTAKARAQLWILNRIVPPAAVSLISNHRVLQPRKMYADLVRSSRDKLAAEQRKADRWCWHASQSFEEGPARPRGSPRRDDGTAFSTTARQAGRDGAAGDIDASIHYC